MGVYIKGMEMPTSCPCELLGIGYDLHCSFAEGIPARVKEYYECCQNDTRPSWCPLVPVPPHGDLIERKDAYDSILEGMVMTGYQSRALDCINEIYAPTIIPAEEGE